MAVDVAVRVEVVVVVVVVDVATLESLAGEGHRTVWQIQVLDSFFFVIFIYTVCSGGVGCMHK